MQLNDEEWQWSDKARESDDTNRETVMRGELGGCRSKRESADNRTASCGAVAAESLGGGSDGVSASAATTAETSKETLEQTGGNGRDKVEDR